jgi:hypothetical protein
MTLGVMVSVTEKRIQSDTAKNTIISDTKKAVKKVSSPAEDYCKAYYERRKILAERIRALLPPEIVLEGTRLHESEMAGMLSSLNIGSLVSVRLNHEAHTNQNKEGRPAQATGTDSTGQTP